MTICKSVFNERWSNKIMKCISTKNKTSTDRCPSNVLKGLRFCGRHAKMKIKRVWRPQVDLTNHAIKIQAWWRGYSLQRLLKLGGPNVLNRKLSNDYDELSTLVSKREVSPLDYFEFEEDGINFWFDIKSIYQWSANNPHPQNPYTKKELSLETRKRMREIINIRKIRKLPLMVTIAFKDQTVESRVNQLCQTLEEHLHKKDFWYGPISPNEFLNLSFFEIELFTTIIFYELVNWSFLKRKSPMRVRICWMIHDLIYKSLREQTTESPMLKTVRCLMFILGRIKNPYPICHIIWTSIHRM